MAAGQQSTIPRELLEQMPQQRGSIMGAGHEMTQSEVIGGATFCLIPFGHWAPVPEYCVEEYEPRAKRRGWRLSERGMKLFADMGWPRTKATEGLA
jgi:hypothetical protein